MRTAKGGFLVCLVLMGLFGWFCGGSPRPPDRLPDSEIPEAPPPPYATIEQKLRSSVWSDRSGAILDVLRGKHRQAIPILYRLLANDPHVAVRETAALALADFNERGVVPRLAAMLGTTTGPSPEAILEALTRLKDPRGAAAVVPLLDRDQNVLRLKAVEALVAMRATGHVGTILRMAQKNRDPERAKTYAMVLGQLQAKSAEGYLVKLAETSEPGPTLAASYLALGRIQSRVGVPVLVRALAHNFAKGRENATAALIQVGDRRAVDLAFPLLSHGEEEVRYAAVEVVSEIPHPSTALWATELLKKAGANTAERRALGPAAVVLGRRKVKSARPEIERLLADRTMAERERLARALGWIGSQKSVALLISVLEEPSGEGRYGAAWAVGVMEAREALPALRKSAASSDRKLAVISIEALGSFGGSETIVQLREIAKKDESLAPFALESIALTKGEEARLIIENLARTEDGTLKRQAIVALGRRKEAASVPALIAILENGPGELHRSLFLALSQTTGQRLTTRNAWLNWYRAQAGRPGR